MASSLAPTAELLAVAFPGRAAATLVGRRVRMATGYGGLGLRCFTPASMGLSRFLARDVKAASTKAHMSDAGSEELGLVEKLEEMRKMYPAPSRRVYPASSLTDNEAMVLEELELFADKGYTLVKDVAARLKPAAGTRLFKALYAIGQRFASLVGLSLMVVSNLDAMHRLVSSSCGVPLPPTADLGPGTHTPMENCLENEVILVVERIYMTVEADVRAMISTYYFFVRM